MSHSGEKPNNKVMRPAFIALLVALTFAAIEIVAAERDFSVPLDRLKAWSESITTSLNVEILGHSKVHSAASDCEMHLGAKMPGYNGDPPGWVLEPMNLCLEPFPGKSMPNKKDWESFGDDLNGAKIRVEGVPRIWPEHLVGGGESNPNHALELHPLTRLQHGSHVYEFSDFIYAPEGLEGISEKTIRSTLTDIDVNVTEKDGNVEIAFDAGNIGNFAVVDLTFDSSSIKQLDGGFRMDGQVVFGRKDGTRVSLVTVANSEFGKAVARLKQSKAKKNTLEALVLFSLDPAVLYQAAKDSHGKQVALQNPIQLIIYGQTDSER
jgi:hypothetical protein